MRNKKKSINTLNIGLILIGVSVIFILLSVLFPNLIDKYILPISKIIGLLSISSGIWIAVGEYQLKVAAEIRLGESSKAENDVKLLNLFTHTFDIAHGRGETIISETIIEKLFDKNVITAAEYTDFEKMDQKLNLAIRTKTLGLASQEAAITAIGELGSNYEILKSAALQGLNSLKEQMKNIPQGQQRVLSPIETYIQASIDKINA